MIFAISPGSEGVGDERYAAYLPFVLAPGRDIGPVDSPVRRGQGVEMFTLEKVHGLYSLTVGAFESYEAATAAQSRLQAALLWVSLKYKVGLRYSKSAGSVDLFDEPKPVPDRGVVRNVAEAVGWDATDGQYDADKSVIRPEHKRLLRWQTGSATVHTGLGLENFFEAVGEAFSFSRPDGIRENAKLQLGLEMYGSFAFESSDNAQFLTLVTALEALLPEYSVSADTITALEDAKATVKRLRDTHPQESHQRSDLDHLLGRLGSLKYQAIGTSLRQFVTETLGRHPELARLEKTIAQLKNLYTARSNLIHEGVSDSDEVREHLSFLRDFVPKLLETLYREATSSA